MGRVRWRDENSRGKVQKVRADSSDARLYRDSALTQAGGCYGDCAPPWLGVTRETRMNTTSNGRAVCRQVGRFGIKPS
jgi:hypothetical protein